MKEEKKKKNFNISLSPFGGKRGEYIEE